MTKLTEAIKKYWIILAILLLASILRLWSLSTNPPHLTSDEAALGYNAYSILKTGRDEHGEFFPLIFKSFGDWKPGLYVYLTIPFVTFLGLTELAVRLPNAVLGITAVWLTYLVIGKLFQEDFKKEIHKVQLLGSFFLAISPWHIHFSRGGWEVGVSLALTLAGIYFFLRSLQDKENKKRSLFLIFSVIFFVLTLWTYQGAKLATGIVVLGLLLFFWRNLIRFPRQTLFKCILVGFIFSLPIFLSFFQGKVGRLSVFNVFSYPRPDVAVEEILHQDDIDKKSILFNIYHAENIHFAKGIIERWMNHFSGRFLFFEGDWGSKRHNIPDGGMFLFLDIFIFILGFIVLSKFGFSKGALLVWFWLLFAPLPAALSRDSIHGVRSFNMVFPLVIVLSLGAYQLLRFLKKPWGKLMVLVFIAFYLSNYLYYLDQYFVHIPQRTSQYWQYGYKQVVQKVEDIKDQYEEVIVEQNYAQPYIFFLFYTKSSSAYREATSSAYTKSSVVYEKYSPEKYQAQAKEYYVASQSGDVGLVSKLGKVSFRPINWSADRLMSNKLFVVEDDGITVPENDMENTEGFKYVERITYKDGKPGFILLGVR